MADINQILAGGAGAGTTADFSGIPKILDYFYKSKDEAAKNDLRDAFKGGVPTTPDGQPDFGAMAKVLYQKGGLDQGNAASNLGIQRDQLRLGQEASAAMGRAESGGPPQTTQPIISPSSSRPNGVADPAYRTPVNGGQEPQAQPQQGAQPRQATVTQILAAQGIPNDQLQAASASVARQIGVDPTQPLDLQDPQVRNVLAPAIAQIKRMNLGQVQPQQPGDQPQQVAQAPQQALPQQQPNPQQNQGTFGAPPATPTRGLVPTGTDPEVQKQIATYTAIASNPAYPKSVQEAALTRLKALQDQTSPTPDIKNYDLYRRQGGNLPFNEWQADTEAKKTGATEEAKLSSAKYQTLVDTGVKAQQEIPQLEMLQKQMDDPNFFSGIGEKYNLAYKRLKSAAGIDPDAAVPQEFLRKATAASVLGSFGALKGLGPIRVAEMNLAKQAAAAPDNSIPANKLLVEIQKRTYERQADIAEMAQNYKEANGTLDPGFDKKVTAYFKAHPIFSDAEIQDFHKAIGEAPKTTTAAASVPAQFPNARKAPDGNFYVPDPQRPGKYLKVVQ